MTEFTHRGFLEMRKNGTACSGTWKDFPCGYGQDLSTNEEGNPRFCTNKVITFVVSMPRIFFNIPIVRSLLITHKKVLL